MAVRVFLLCCVFIFGFLEDDMGNLQLLERVFSLDFFFDFYFITTDGDYICTRHTRRVLYRFFKRNLSIIRRCNCLHFHNLFLTFMRDFEHTLGFGARTFFYTGLLMFSMFMLFPFCQRLFCVFTTNDHAEQQYYLHLARFYFRYSVASLGLDIVSSMFSLCDNGLDETSPLYCIRTFFCNVVCCRATWFVRECVEEDKMFRDLVGRCEKWVTWEEAAMLNRIRRGGDAMNRFNRDSDYILRTKWGKRDWAFWCTEMEVWEREGSVGERPVLWGHPQGMEVPRLGRVPGRSMTDAELEGFVERVCRKRGFWKEDDLVPN